MNLSFDTQILAKSYEYLPTCHSTNDIMLEALKYKELRDGHLVVTFDQTRGRGQWGNKWETKANQNLTFTLYLEPKILMDHLFSLNMMVSLAIKEALECFTTKPIKVKWPNDIFVLDTVWRKIGGVLIENQIQGSVLKSSVIGIGVNVNQVEFNDLAATSLALLENRGFDLVEVLGKIISKLDKFYIAYDWETLKYNYTKNLLFYGEKGKFEDERGVFEGEVLGVNSLGQLAMRVGQQIENFNIKEIKFII